MRSSEIESWALSIIGRALAGQPIEDVRVELKSEWPKDTYRAARRIAGHANAAHGESVLWLIGIDEKKQEVVGAGHVELANWWPQVQSFFAELPPDMTPLNVPYDGRTVTALLFTTERRPFVIKVPGGGPIDLEVPWRDGTMIRSAKRRELVTILTVTYKNPSVEVLKGTLRISESSGGHYSGKHGLWLEVYIVPQNADRVVIPFHHCEGSLRFSCAETPFAFSSIWFYNSNSLPGPRDMVVWSANEIIVDGPGWAAIEALPPDLNAIGRVAFSPAVHIDLKLWPTGSEVPIAVIADLAEMEAEAGVRRQFAVRGSA